MKTKGVVASEEVKVGRCFGLSCKSLFQMKIKRVVASVEVKAGLKRIVVADEDKAGRCFIGSKRRSLF
jgi:hypothetical protein